MGRPAFTSPVERPADQAARLELLDQGETSTAAIADQSTDTVQVLGSVSGKLRVYAAVMREKNGVDPNLVTVDVGPRDSGGTATGDLVSGAVAASPIPMEPAMTVPDGGDLQFVVNNVSGASAEVLVGARYEVL